MEIGKSYKCIKDLKSNYESHQLLLKENEYYELIDVYESKISVRRFKVNGTQVISGSMIKYKFRTRDKLIQSVHLTDENTDKQYISTLKEYININDSV